MGVTTFPFDFDIFLRSGSSTQPEIAALRPLVPVFLSYVLSFVFLGIYWSNHHHLLQAITQVDGRVLPDLRIDQAAKRQRENALEHALAGQNPVAVNRGSEPGGSGTLGGCGSQMEHTGTRATESKQARRCQQA